MGTGHSDFMKISFVPEIMTALENLSRASALCLRLDPVSYGALMYQGAHQSVYNEHAVLGNGRSIPSPGLPDRPSAL